MKKLANKAANLAANYYQPTPAKWRKIGDAIQDVAIIAGFIVALVAAPPVWVPVAILVVGRIGKIITNFTK
jgi:purine-cytosine permease-like protein